jgi:hypothetical protein
MPEIMGQRLPWRDRGEIVGSVMCVSCLRVMSHAQLRELVVLFAISSALTLAVFFLALWLLPFERFPPFSSPRFPGFPLI